MSSSKSKLIAPYLSYHGLILVEDSHRFVGVVVAVAKDGEVHVVVHRALVRRS